MRPGTARLVLRLVAAAGIPGIIVGSIAGSDAVAMTFGAITVTAALGLILVTAVTSPVAVDAIGSSVEDQIAALVQSGASEAQVRALVADAVRLGQHRQNS
jgi:orotidine-5'-phosphate decarboxylase